MHWQTIRLLQQQVNSERHQGGILLLAATSTRLLAHLQGTTAQMVFECWPIRLPITMQRAC